MKPILRWAAPILGGSFELRANDEALGRRPDIVKRVAGDEVEHGVPGGTERTGIGGQDDTRPGDAITKFAAPGLDQDFVARPDILEDPEVGVAVPGDDAIAAHAGKH